jgi:hypothetical protein
MTEPLTSDRWDEDCHVCGKRIGDHTADGRHPGDEWNSVGCLNLRWLDNGNLECIHGDNVQCDLSPHVKILTYVRRTDLLAPTDWERPDG